VSFSLADGQLGDATAVDGQILDPGGPGVSALVDVPALGPLAMSILAGLLMVLGVGGFVRGRRFSGSS